MMRSILLNASLALAAALVSFLGLEVAVRAYSGIPVLATTNFVAEALDLVRRNTGVVIYDETLGWRLRDNHQGGASFTTGAHGLRMNGVDIVPPREGGVLAVGDSFTAGSGVNNDQTWPAQLERAIGQPVHNGASGAWGVDQMVLRAEMLMPILRPRTLIVGILADDSLRNNFEIYGGAYKPYFVIEAGKAVLKGVPAPRIDGGNIGLNIWRRIFGHSYLVYDLARRLGYEAWWIANEYRYRQVHANEVGVAISCHLMDRLVALKSAHGVRVIVLMQYGAQGAMLKDALWYGPPVVACARERGLETVDTHPTLHAISVSEPDRFKSLWIVEGGQLGHMSAAGNALIADLLQKQYGARP